MHPIYLLYIFLIFILGMFGIAKLNDNMVEYSCDVRYGDIMIPCKTNIETLSGVDEIFDMGEIGLGCRNN